MCWNEKGIFFIRYIAGSKCEGRIGETVEQVEDICSDVIIGGHIKYIGDKLSTSGRYQALPTARKKIGRTKFRQYGKLLY